MQRQHSKTTRNLENQGNITLPKDNNTQRQGDLQFKYKELKIVVLNKLNWLQETVENNIVKSRKQYMNKIRNLADIEIMKMNTLWSGRL